MLSPILLFSTAMVRNVRVRIANATALLVSWDALQVSHVLHYTIYYSAVSKELNQVVDTSTNVVPSTNTSDIINVREFMAGVEHQFEVTASVEIEEVVYERMVFMPAIFLFGKARYLHGCILKITRLFQAGWSMNIIISQMKQCFSFRWDL